MLKHSLLLAASVALCTAAHAQSIVVTVSGGWVMNGGPANCSDVNNFNVSNPSGGGFLQGGASAFVAGSPNFTTAGATVQGILSSGASVNAGTSASTTCNESYTNAAGTGNATVSASIVNGPFVNNTQGSGFSGFCRTSAVFVSSITARISGGAVSQAVPAGGFGIIQTTPVSVSNSATGMSNFTWAAQTTAACDGTLTGIGAGIQLNSNTGVDATITLN